MLSNISSVAYIEQVKTLANNLTWTNQVELRNSQGPALFYIFFKMRENISTNEVMAENPMPKPHGDSVNNTYLP